MKKLDKLFKYAKKFTPSAEDKQSILGVVSLHISKHPIKLNTEKITSPYVAPVINRYSDRHNKHNSGWSSLFALSNLKHKKYMPIIIALMLVLGGGTSLAANYSLPGDTLYPVKVNVNENIKSAFSFSENASAKTEIKIAKTRLEEAAKLATKGEISAEAKAKIEKNFSKHADKVTTLIASMESRGDTEKASRLSSNFENSLSVHSAILAKISDNDADDKKEIDELNAKVDAYIKSENESRLTKEDKANSSVNTDTKISATGAMNSANNKIAEVEKYIQNNKDATVEVKAKATAELNQAKELTIDAETKMKAEAYGDASIAYKKAFRTAQNAKTHLTGENRVNVENDSSIDSQTNTSSGNTTEIKINTNSNINSNNGNTNTKTQSNGSLKIGL